MGDSDWEGLVWFLYLLDLLDNPTTFSGLFIFLVCYVGISIFLEFANPLLQWIYLPAVIIFFLILLVSSLFAGMEAYDHAGSCKLICGLLAGTGAYLALNSFFFMLFSGIYTITFEMESSFFMRTIQGVLALVIVGISFFVIVVPLLYLTDWLENSSVIFFKSLLLLLFGLLCSAGIFWLAHITGTQTQLMSTDIRDLSLFSWIYRSGIGLQLDACMTSLGYAVQPLTECIPFLF